MVSRNLELHICSIRAYHGLTTVNSSDIMRKVWVGRHSGNPFISLVYDPTDQFGLESGQVRLAFVSRTDRKISCLHTFDRLTARRVWKKEGNLEHFRAIRDVYFERRPSLSLSQLLRPDGVKE